MKRTVLAAGLALAAACAEPPAPKAAFGLGSPPPSVALSSLDGSQQVSLDAFKGKPLVVTFWSFKCPTGERSMEKWADLDKRCKESGATFFGVCSYGESADALRSYHKDRPLPYTLLLDPGRKAAAAFDARVVTESYIFDASGKLVYRGALSPGAFDALQEAASGKPVSRPETEAMG